MGSIEEAQLAVRYGASALGFVSAMPSGPGPVDEELIAEIVPTVPPGVATFLLTCQSDADAIIGQQHRTRVNTLQLVDSVPIATYEKLYRALPGISIVQVIHVRGEASIDKAKSVAPYVNAILLDSGNPSLTVKELGGTGRVHDWSISRRIREGVGRPLFLAGGLKAENVAQAMTQVEPYGLDLCSGVRTDGKLDGTKLSAFFRAVDKVALNVA